MHIVVPQKPTAKAARLDSLKGFCVERLETGLRIEGWSSESSKWDPEMQRPAATRYSFRNPRFGVLGAPLQVFRNASGPGTIQHPASFLQFSVGFLRGVPSVPVDLPGPKCSPQP